MKKIIGIYSITNLYNNKIYIGQSNDIKRRWRNHKNDLNKNKHQNMYLQNSWNKHGENAFDFKIIELCELSLLDSKEMYYINKLKTFNKKYGYNLIYNNNGKFTFTDEVIERMRESHSYEYVSILQFDLTGSFLKYFDSLSIAARSINGTPSGIRNCANRLRGFGASKTYKGYLWVFKEDYYLFKKLDLRQYLLEDKSFQVNKYEYPSGEYIKTYNTVLEAANDNDISVDVISMCVRNVQLQSSGFTYRKYDGSIDNISIFVKEVDLSNRYKKVISIDKNTMQPYKIYESIVSAVKDGFNSGHISECCKGKRKTYKGYIWKYFNEDGIKEINETKLSDL